MLLVNVRWIQRTFLHSPVFIHPPLLISSPTPHPSSQCCRCSAIFIFYTFFVCLSYFQPVAVELRVACDKHVTAPNIRNFFRRFSFSADNQSRPATDPSDVHTQHFQQLFVNFFFFFQQIFLNRTSWPLFSVIGKVIGCPWDKGKVRNNRQRVCSPALALLPGY